MKRGLTLLGGIGALYFLSSCIFMVEYSELESAPLTLAGDDVDDGDVEEVSKGGDSVDGVGDCQLSEFWEGILEEGMSCEAILVVAKDGSDSGAGSVGSPLLTIGEALTRGGSVIALVGEGVWREAVRVDRGVAIVGGVDRELLASEARPKVEVEKQGEHTSGLEVIGASSKVLLQGFDIEASGGMTNYGARILDSSFVELREMKIVADKGGRGADGAPGAGGATGEEGTNGGSADVWSPGVGGINEACPEANGGDGGQGAYGGQRPQEGESSRGGAIGRAGVGEAGAEVQGGADGSWGEPSGYGDDWWEPGESGTKGEDGAHGIGGAGGAGGEADGGSGGGGGGGGAGGCKGSGGGGGEGGGSSIGILVSRSSVSLIGGEVQARDGGAGGAGGPGGEGGQGRPPGLGVTGIDGGQRGFAGGHGSDGGTGGQGGDGRGGVSFSVGCGPQTTLNINGTELKYGNGGEDGGELLSVGLSGESANCDAQ